MVEGEGTRATLGCHTKEMSSVGNAPAHPLVAAGEANEGGHSGPKKPAENPDRALGKASPAHGCTTSRANPDPKPCVIPHCDAFVYVSGLDECPQPR